jgi:hypothetical protein
MRFLRVPAAKAVLFRNRQVAGSGACVLPDALYSRNYAFPPKHPSDLNDRFAGSRPYQKRPPVLGPEARRGSDYVQVNVAALCSSANSQLRQQPVSLDRTPCAEINLPVGHRRHAKLRSLPCLVPVVGSLRTIPKLGCQIRRVIGM